MSAYQKQNNFLNALSGLYGGVGLGFIKNDVINVRYYDINYYPGDDKSTEAIVPFNLGINFPLSNRWGYHKYDINLNFQSTIDFDEGLDGYTPVKGKNDMYAFLSLGLKYHFGFMGLDRRR